MKCLVLFLTHSMHVHAGGAMFCSQCSSEEKRVLTLYSHEDATYRDAHKIVSSHHSLHGQCVHERAAREFKGDCAVYARQEAQVDFLAVLCAKCVYVAQEYVHRIALCLNSQIGHSAHGCVAWVSSSASVQSLALLVLAGTGALRLLRREDARSTAESTVSFLIGANMANALARVEMALRGLCVQS